MVVTDRLRLVAAPLLPKKAERLPGVDRMRGLVIVLMALDHVRDFFDADALRFSPADLTHTYPALFLTRFVTHYCAPTFALLAGVSAFLHGEQLRDRASLARFLWTRGLWLILLDAFVISPIWTLQLGKIELGTLWAIGCGMIALSPLIRFPSWVSLAIGALILLTHDLLDNIHAAAFGAYGPFWNLLHEPGPLPFGLNGGVSYPALPWIGVVVLGYGLGPLFLVDAGERKRVLILLGVGALTLFAILRGGNLYGDPRPWSAQPTTTFTAMAFLNVSKYPPSLLYALVTLGPALILSPWMERLGGVAGGILATFGRTPLFFYVLHLYAALGAAAAFESARGFNPRQIAEFVAKRAAPENFGAGLSGAYVAWIALVAALYPFCLWFSRLKRRRREWWLSYL